MLPFAVGAGIPASDQRNPVGKSPGSARRWASIRSCRDRHPGNRRKTCGFPRETESSWRWLARSDSGTRDAKKCLPPLQRRGRMTRSADWATVVQRRNDGRRPQPTNQGMDRSGGKPLSSGRSLRRRSVIPVVTIRRCSADQDGKCRAGRGAMVGLRGPMQNDGRCEGLRWSSRFQRVSRISFPDPLGTSAAGPHDES